MPENPLRSPQSFPMLEFPQIFLCPVASPQIPQIFLISGSSLTLPNPGISQDFSLSQRILPALPNSPVLELSQILPSAGESPQMPQISLFPPTNPRRNLQNVRYPKILPPRSSPGMEVTPKSAGKSRAWSSPEPKFLIQMDFREVPHPDRYSLGKGK